MRGTNFGQEITTNSWQIGFQNFIRLILLSMFLGLLGAMTWFGLFAPENAFEAVNLYFYSWLYCHIPFGCSDNANYNLQVLQPTMLQLAGILQGCKIVFGLGTFSSAIGLRTYFVKRGQHLKEERYVRGALLLSPEALIAEVNKRYSETCFDVWLGREQVRIPEHLTYRHLAVVGASGVGKTQAINSILRQLENKSNQKVLVVDLNGQYYARFGQPGDFILSLYDKRSEPWEFWRENAPEEFFAEALIELDRNDKFFAPAGRALLADLLRISKNIDDLWGNLTSPVGELLKKLQGGISPSLLGAPDQAAGVMATASLKLNFLRHLNHWSENKEFFSLTEWANSPGNDWVFLIVRDQDLAASKPLLRTWFDLATLGVLQREEDKENSHLWLIADELPGLGQLPTLGKLLSQGRKYKATVVAGYQTPEQLKNIYGSEGANEIFQGLQNKLIYRSPDPDTAKHNSLELGEQEVEEINSSIQFGNHPASDRNSVSKTIKVRPVVMPSELQNLPDLQAYIKIGQFDPTLIHFDYQRYPTINEPTCCEIPSGTGRSKSTFLITSEQLEKNTETQEGDYDFDPESDNSGSGPDSTDYDFDPNESNNFLDF
ncbi:MAG: type IV secretion system DNA-binding domain-containing protein [Prochloraceae cyanobacterium]|nr:type IV secretion system DNA-binding domain-containing protein [Prochloraceae cyanobacterium]